MKYLLIALAVLFGLFGTVFAACNVDETGKPCRKYEELKKMLTPSERAVFEKMQKNRATFYNSLSEQEKAALDSAKSKMKSKRKAKNKGKDKK
jgi:hypothetical protein